MVVCGRFEEACHLAGLFSHCGVVITFSPGCCCLEDNALKLAVKVLAIVWIFDVYFHLVGLWSEVRWMIERSSSPRGRHGSGDCDEDEGPHQCTPESFS